MHAAKWGLEVRRLLKEQHVVSVALEENVRALLLRAEDEAGFRLPYQVRKEASLPPLIRRSRGGAPGRFD